MFGSQRPQWRSIRFSGYDYRNVGAYFVTVCVLQKRCVFGQVIEGVMRLNRYGAIVAEEWQRTAELRRNVILDEFVVMPNHFHGIVVLKEAGMARHAPTGVFGKPQAQALPAVVGAFKSAVTRRINHGRVAHQLAPVRVWQRNYYERIIRDEKELNQTRRYILENPLCWVKDEENPDNQL